MSGSAGEGGLDTHRAAAPRSIWCAVLTVSDTRRGDDDTGGALIAELLAGAGHEVVHRDWVSDDREAIARAAEQALDSTGARALIVTGGTGVAPRDVTPEAIEGLLDKTLPGFGELFRMLSYEEIGSAALLSRALAGMRGRKVIFALPGSRGAIRTAMEKLVLPELGHLVGEGHKSGRGGPGGHGGHGAKPA